MSSGRPTRGVRCDRSARLVASGESDSCRSEMTRPGATALQRSPRLPYMVAIDQVREFRAAFDAAYAVRTSSPVRPDADDVLMIEPPPASSMWGITCLHVSIGPRTLTAMV